MKIRAVLLFVLGLVAATAAHGQVATVSGNLKDLGVNNAISRNTYVQFNLQNYGSNIPRVLGTNAIVSAQSLPFRPDSSGNISGTIQENDSISPANTFYRVCVFNNGLQFQCNNYFINDDTWNLNTAIPITTVVPPPLNPAPANEVFAGPESGPPGTPGFRDLVGADLPNPSLTTLGGVKAIDCSTLPGHVQKIGADGQPVCSPDSGGGGGGGSPGTPPTSFQYNMGGLLAGASGVTTDDGSNLRICGPIPWIDFTCYMRDSNNNQVDCSTLSTSDPTDTGSIAALGTTLTVASGTQITNGCGLAIDGAGPVATVVTASTATGSVTRCADPPTCGTTTGTQVMFTIGSGTLPLVPGVGDGDGAGQGVSVSGCSDSNLNTVWTPLLLNFSSGGGVKMFTYRTAGSASTTATGCVPKFYNAWAHGTTGSTTWIYYIAPFDTLGGVGAAIGPFTITNGNATLNNFNNNWLGWQYTVGARGFVVYRDDGAGGAQSCRDLAYTNGYNDWGTALPFGCPTWVPTLPPGSPTAGKLITKAVSGGGTTTIVVANAATTTVSSKSVNLDSTLALAEAINDDITFQNGAGRAVGSYGVVIPAGRWPFAGNMPTDTIVPINQLTIHLQGTPVFNSFPWMIGSNYQILGEGSSGTPTTSQSFHTTKVERGLKMPAGLVIRGVHADIEGLSLENMFGHAIMLTTNPATGTVSGGIRMNKIMANVQDGYGIGVPLLIDQNLLYNDFDNMAFVPRSDKFPASVLFTSTSYNGNGHTDNHFTNIYTLWHHFVVSYPGGYNCGSGTDFSINVMKSEEHGQYPTGGLVALDTGTASGTPGACSAARLAALTANTLQSADNADKHLFTVYGSQTAQANFKLDSVSQFQTKTRCDNGSVSCVNGVGRATISVDSSMVADGQSIGVLQSVDGEQFLLRRPLIVGLAYGIDHFAEFGVELPAPHTMTVTGTSSGSLAAGTYCFVATGLDFQSSPGETFTSPDSICTTVGSSSSIQLEFQTIDQGRVYSGFRVYYGSVSGTYNNYFTIATDTSTTHTYNFTTTAGASSGSPATLTGTSTARSSWLGYLSPGSLGSCLLCGGAATQAYEYLGIGMSVPLEKLHIFGNTRTSGNFIWDAGTSFTGTFTHANSANRIYTFPNIAGTVGLFTATPTPGNCILAGANFSLVDSGSTDCGGGGGGGMNPDMTNMANPTAMSQSLIPGAVNTVALCSAALPCTNLFLGTVANRSWSIDSSALTGNRVTTSPDANTVLPVGITASANNFLTGLNASTGVFTRAQPTLANIAAGAAPTGTFDFSGVTVLLARVAAGLTTAANGSVGFDSTANNYHAYNGADSIVLVKPTATSVADNDCMKYTVAGSKITANTAGAPCGTLTPSNTKTLTNTTLDQEGTGNVVTTVVTAYLDSAGCNNSTPGPSWDLMTTNIPAAVCLTGSNTQQGVLAYDDAVNESAQFKFMLPTTWVGTVDITLNWLVITGGGSNAVKWTVSTACAAAGESYDVAFNGPQTITTNVAANNLHTLSSQAGVTVTGCAAGEMLHFKIGRDTTDTFTGTANMIGARLVLRKTGA